MSRPSAAGWGHPTRPEHERGRQKEREREQYETYSHTPVLQNLQSCLCREHFKHLDPRLHCYKLTGTDQLTTFVILVAFF